jgi:hypothetical protein
LFSSRRHASTYSRASRSRISIASGGNQKAIQKKSNCPVESCLNDEFLIFPWAIKRR